MKSKNITHIILEGCDGVGKDTIKDKIWRAYNFQYRVYCRGEISDYVYAKKFNRKFISTQRGLPFLYVVLIGDEEIIEKHIKERAERLSWSSDLLEKELEKISDNELFEKYAALLSKEYHILTIYCKDKDIHTLCVEIYKKTIEYINNLSTDIELTPFNVQYKLGCDKLKIKFDVRDNQPYMNDIRIMADAHLHTGAFETFDNKDIPHNLIFCCGYDINLIDRKVPKTVDFAYPINSKILQRLEVYEYYTEFEKNKISFLATDSIYVPKYNCANRMSKCFGDEYIRKLSIAKATIYTARDLVDIEMMTCRLYEGILANQIVFVDKLSDPDCKILKNIYNDNERLINLLYITPETVVKNYRALSDDDVDMILHTQQDWFFTQIKEFKDKGLEL